MMKVMVVSCLLLPVAAALSLAPPGSGPQNPPQIYPIPVNPAPSPPPVDPPSCLPVLCAKQCPNDDYILDSNGCSTCKCRSDSAASSGVPWCLAAFIQCTTDCPNGYIYDEFQCNTCKCKTTSTEPCPLRACPAIDCPSGMKKDAQGCETCECANDATPTGPCPLRACPAIYCPSGMKKDAQGCVTCECANDDPPTPKPPRCPLVRCSVSCGTSGFQVDANGCQTCSCKITSRADCVYKGQTYNYGPFQPDPCTFCTCENGIPQCASPACALPACPNPVTLPGQCCPSCPSTPCPLRPCPNCPSGYKTDENGCTTCECKDSTTPTGPCPLRVCAAIFCPGGMKKDAQGCDTCECANDVPPPSPKPCPVFRCKSCPLGYKTDADGCQTCECKETGCVYQGKTYPEGSFRPDPCSSCTCRNGIHTCAVMGCALPNCPNPVTPPGQCCPKCQETGCPEIAPRCPRFCPPGQVARPVKDRNGCDVACRCQTVDIPTTPQIPSCAPSPCPFLCSSGYKTDSNGCEICECKDGGAVCSRFPCAYYKPVCPNGLRVDSRGCEVCQCKELDNSDPPAPRPPNCPLVRCSVSCGTSGFQVDANGCQTCSCKITPDGPCPQLGCHTLLRCGLGFAEDERGCPTCRCRDAPVALSTKPPVTKKPVKLCRQSFCGWFRRCRYGFRKDRNGCPTCRCQSRPSSGGEIPRPAIQPYPSFPFLRG